MTPEEVIALADRNARKLGLRWMTVDKVIRTADNWCCPLEVAANAPRGSYRDAAHSLGAENACLSLVANAADGWRTQELDKLRGLMLTTFDFEDAR